MATYLYREMNRFPATCTEHGDRTYAASPKGMFYCERPDCEGLDPRDIDTDWAEGWTVEMGHLMIIVGELASTEDLAEMEDAHLYGTPDPDLHITGAN